MRAVVAIQKIARSQTMLPVGPIGPISPIGPIAQKKIKKHADKNVGVFRFLTVCQILIRS